MIVLSRLGWLAALALATVAFTASAQEQEAAALPDLGAPAGAVLTAHSERPYDSYALPVSTYFPGATGARTVKGRVVWAGYRLRGGERTTAEIMEGYRTRLTEMGFRPLFDCSTEGCGGFDFRFAVQLLPPPAMLMDIADFAQLSAVRGEEGNETYASILVSRLLGAIHIQTVVVGPGEPDHTMEGAPEPEAATQPVVLPRDEVNLLSQLKTAGHAPVRGLFFDSGGATLSEGSAPALDVLAEVLTQNQDLSVVIVGHSDNQGTLEANIALSKRRAEAVRDALIQRGVAAKRLDAQGVGYLAPVTTNASPEGRSVNRRVELVVR